MPEKWRTLDASDRWAFQEWCRLEMSGRHAKGVAKYHSQDTIPAFKGEPLQHAIEEALDLLFYLAMQRYDLGRPG